MDFLKGFFRRHSNPKKGLMAFEWVILVYLIATLGVVLLMRNYATNPNAMISGRMRVLAIGAALWAVYRMLPCRFTLALRVVVHLVLLSWWYPDTYELNRMLPNLDYVFAGWEQSLFGFQPALLFSQVCSSKVFSELMYLGYSSYFPMVAVVSFYYLLKRYTEFQRCIWVIIGAFFIHYVIFILLPVVGPQYYYCAVGEDQIAQAVFPNLNDYFNTHQESLPLPGWDGGLFQYCVQMAHEAGERPTAAFPSSHVGVTMVLMLLAWHSKSRRLFLCLLPFAILMFFATFYIKAHYAIDAIAGLASGALCYAFLMWFSQGWTDTTERQDQKKGKARKKVSAKRHK